MAQLVLGVHPIVQCVWSFVEPDDALRKKKEEYHPNVVFTEADQRRSAQGMGIVAIIMVAIEVGILLILDCARIRRTLQRLNLIRPGR